MIVGYGAPEVATDLLIVGDDWYMDRGDYDGSEWFNFHTVPKEPTEFIEIKALTIQQSKKVFGNEFCGWRGLKELNEVAND